MGHRFILALGALLSMRALDAHAQGLVPSGQFLKVDSVLMERTRCFGRCPAYRVLLTATGLVRFWSEGKTGMPTASDSVAVPLFMIVRGDATIGKVMTLPDDIEGSAMCADVRTDLPHVILTLFTTGDPKRVVDYLGCGGVPSELRGLEAAIDSATNVRRWSH